MPLHTLWRTGRIEADTAAIPELTLIFGEFGQGKTALLTYLLHHLYEEQSSRKLLVNYHTTIPSQPLHLGSLTVGELAGSIIGIDGIEAAHGYERSFSNSTLKFKAMLNGARKTNTKYIVTTRFPAELTRAILRRVDLFLQVKMQHNSLRVFVHDWYFQYPEFHDGKSRHFGAPSHERAWPFSFEDRDWEFTIDDIESVYPMFDTMELPTPSWIKDAV